MKYTIRYERNPDGWWTAQAKEEPGAITQGKSLDQARKRVREALEALVGAKARKAELVDEIALPAAVRRSVSQAQAKRAKVDKAQEDAIAATATVAVKLTRDMGLTVRDAGEILGISYQRVQQLVS